MSVYCCTRPWFCTFKKLGIQIVSPLRYYRSTVLIRTSICLLGSILDVWNLRNIGETSKSEIHDILSDTRPLLKQIYTREGSSQKVTWLNSTEQHYYSNSKLRYYINIIVSFYNHTLTEFHTQPGGARRRKRPPRALSWQACSLSTPSSSPLRRPPYFPTSGGWWPSYSLPRAMIFTATIAVRDGTCPLYIPWI